MASRLILALGLAGGMVLAGQAQETVSADAAAVPPVPASTEELASVRDPFWPVGYQPQPSAAQPASSAGEEAPKAGLRISNLTEEQQARFKALIRVSGIMKTGRDYWARVNNQLVAAGDEIEIVFDGQPFTFLVRGITKDNVQLEPKGQ